MIYTLWDTDSGNLLGTYDAKQDALDVIRTAIGAYGPSYVDGLVLGTEDDDGRPKAIAEGSDLAKLALAIGTSG